jgi:hypothetical protein
VKKPPFLLALTATFATLFASLALSQDSVSARTLALHQRILTLDTHLDTTAKMDDSKWNVLDRHSVKDGQVDYPRMLEGGLDGGFWAVSTGQQGRSIKDYRMAGHQPGRKAARRIECRIRTAARTVQGAHHPFAQRCRGCIQPSAQYR